MAFCFTFLCNEDICLPVVNLFHPNFLCWFVIIMQEPTAIMLEVSDIMANFNSGSFMDNGTMNSLFCAINDNFVLQCNRSHDFSFTRISQQMNDECTWTLGQAHPILRRELAACALFPCPIMHAACTALDVSTFRVVSVWSKEFG